MAYDSRNWKAVQTARDFSGTEFDLTVTGELELVRSNQTPTLSEANPQGKSHTTLLIDVAVHDADLPGADVLIWKEVSYTCRVQPGQFAHVTLQGAVDIQTVSVEIILS
jgi:hypothetical protein